MTQSNKLLLFSIVFALTNLALLVRREKAVGATDTVYGVVDPTDIFYGTGRATALLLALLIEPSAPMRSIVSRAAATTQPPARMRSSTTPLAATTRPAVSGLTPIPRATTTRPVGYVALYNNTTGNWNTASGSSALFSNTTGSNNTATGLQALKSNTTGGENTATGRIALYNNTTGNWNTASGSSALFSDTAALATRPAVR